MTGPDLCAYPAGLENTQHFTTPRKRKGAISDYFFAKKKLPIQDRLLLTASESQRLRDNYISGSKHEDLVVKGGQDGSEDIVAEKLDCSQDDFFGIFIRRGNGSSRYSFATGSSNSQKPKDDSTTSSLAGLDRQLASTDKQLHHHLQRKVEDKVGADSQTGRGVVKNARTPFKCPRAYSGSQPSDQSDYSQTEGRDRRGPSVSGHLKELPAGFPGADASNQKADSDATTQGLTDSENESESPAFLGAGCQEIAPALTSAIEPLINQAGQGTVNAQGQQAGVVLVKKPEGVVTLQGFELLRALKELPSPDTPTLAVFDKLCESHVVPAAGCVPAIGHCRQNAENVTSGTSCAYPAFKEVTCDSPQPPKVDATSSCNNFAGRVGAEHQAGTCAPRTHHFESQGVHLGDLESEREELEVGAVEGIASKNRIQAGQALCKQDSPGTGEHKRGPYLAEEYSPGDEYYKIVLGQLKVCSGAVNPVTSNLNIPITGGAETAVGKLEFNAVPSLARRAGNAGLEKALEHDAAEQLYPGMKEGPGGSEIDRGKDTEGACRESEEGKKTTAAVALGHRHLQCSSFASPGAQCVDVSQSSPLQVRQLSFTGLVTGGQIPGDEKSGQPASLEFPLDEHELGKKGIPNSSSRGWEEPNRQVVQSHLIHDSQHKLHTSEHLSLLKSPRESMMPHVCNTRPFVLQPCRAGPSQKVGAHSPPSKPRKEKGRNPAEIAMPPLHIALSSSTSPSGPLEGCPRHRHADAGCDIPNIKQEQAEIEQQLVRPTTYPIERVSVGHLGTFSAGNDAEVAATEILDGCGEDSGQSTCNLSDMTSARCRLSTQNEPSTSARQETLVQKEEGTVSKGREICFNATLQGAASATLSIGVAGLGSTGVVRNSEVTVPLQPDNAAQIQSRPEFTQGASSDCNSGMRGGGVTVDGPQIVVLKNAAQGGAEAASPVQAARVQDAQAAGAEVGGVDEEGPGTMCGSDNALLQVGGSTQDQELELATWLSPSVCAVYAKKGITKMYPWQVECLNNEGVLHGRNLVYSASTSAGKSLVAEVLLVRRLMTTGSKALLVLPYVALCAEKAEHMEALLEPLGKRVKGFYGTQGAHSLPADTSLAVCTIEKANSLVNQLLEDGRLSELALVVVDELHMVGDTDRGYLLEILLTKLRFSAGLGQLKVKASPGPSTGSPSPGCPSPGNSSGKSDSGEGLQIVGMSATISNISGIAKWLNAALYETQFRPVPLDEVMIVGTQVLNARLQVVRTLRPDPALAHKDPDHIVELCHEVVKGGHSVLLFYPTKKRCENAAIHVAAYLPRFEPVQRESGGNDGPQDALSAIEELKKSPTGLDPVLGKTLPAGVAFHHAGLAAEEREVVEALFRKGIVRVLAATSTLAAGVNLPARRVVFRGPTMGRQPIDGTKYRQMAGRAGRAGIDTRGESIMMCKPDEVEKVSKLMAAGCTPLRSCLGQDQKFMTRALLEVIGGGIVETAEDVHRYVCCTMLFAIQPSPETAKLFKKALEWLVSNHLVVHNGANRVWESTPLGKAVFGSSLTPDEALLVHADLEKARREGVVLHSDLHLLYQVTPTYVELPPNWGIYCDLFGRLSPTDKNVGNHVGVDEQTLYRLAYRGGSNVNPDKLRVCHRFFVALMLAELVKERPLAEVCHVFEADKGKIQSLQENAGRFASMVTTFCERIGWSDLQGLISNFQSRVSFGVKSEILDLIAVPYVKASRARALWTAGYRTVQAIADATSAELARLLFTSNWHSQDGSSNKGGAPQFKHLMVAGKIRSGAKRLLLERAEEAREAAASAMRALGVEIPASLAAPIPNTAALTSESRELTKEVATPSATTGPLSTPRQGQQKGGPLEGAPEGAQGGSSGSAGKHELPLPSGDATVLPATSSAGGSADGPTGRKRSRTGSQEGVGEGEGADSKRPLKVRATGDPPGGAVVGQLAKPGLVSGDAQVAAVHVAAAQDAILTSGTGSVRGPAAFAAGSLQGASHVVRLNGLAKAGKNLVNIKSARIARPDAVGVGLNRDDVGSAPLDAKLGSGAALKSPGRGPAGHCAPPGAALGTGRGGEHGHEPRRLFGGGLPPLPEQHRKPGAAGTALGAPSVEADLAGPGGSALFDGATMTSHVHPVREERARPAATAPVESGPVHVDTMPGGFDAFLKSWDSVQEFCFDLHLNQIPEKLGEAPPGPWEVEGVAVCWRSSPVFYVPVVQKAAKPSRGKAAPGRENERQSAEAHGGARQSAGVSSGQAQAEQEHRGGSDLGGAVDRESGAKGDRERALQDVTDRWGRIAAVLSKAYAVKVGWDVKRQLKALSRPAARRSQTMPLATGPTPAGIGCKQGPCGTDTGHEVFDCMKADAVGGPGVSVGALAAVEAEQGRDRCNEVPRLPGAAPAPVTELVELAAVDLADPLVDMRVVVWILFPDEENLPSIPLEKVAARKLPPEVVAAATRAGRWKSIVRDANGCCRRAALVRVLHTTLWKMLPPESLEVPLAQVEMPLVRVLASMELWGIGLDLEAFKRFRAILHTKIQALEETANRLAGTEFSLASKHEVADVLYVRLKLPVRPGAEPRGKGQPSTNKAALEFLKDVHPIANVIREYRSLTKVLHHTLEPLVNKAKSPGGPMVLPAGTLPGSPVRPVVFGCWQQTATATGRLSMEEPNLQCMEKPISLSTERGGAPPAAQQVEVTAREVLVPSQAGWVLVAADYSQVEARMLAHFSHDPLLLGLLSTVSGDLFRMIAARWLRKSEASVSGCERDRVKQLVYGLLYGMGAQALAEKLHCTPGEAAAHKRTFLETFPGVALWIAGAVAMCRKAGCIETLGGRRRYLEKINNAKKEDHARAARQAVNSICQGSAADVIKMAMIRFHGAITGREAAACLVAEPDAAKWQLLAGMLRGRCHLLLQVHDELVVEVQEEHVQTAVDLLRLCMEGAVSLSVPLLVKTRVGPSWGTMALYEK